MPLKMAGTPAPKTSSIKNTIAIAAGKGGVGKSTITVNLALALHQLGYSVGILDADLYGPSIRKMLPEEQLPGKQGDQLLPAVSKGIKIMTMAYFRTETQATAVRAPIANNVIGQFIETVEWGPLDFLLIDCPPGTGDIQLTIGQKARLNGAILVTTPQEISLLDVRKAADLFAQVQVPIVGVIENMSYYQHPATQEIVRIFGKGGGEKLASELGSPLLGAIPIDPYVCLCCDQGRSLFAENDAKDAGIIGIFNNAAKQVLTRLERLNERTLDLKVIQEDPRVLTLEWKDGHLSKIPAKELQKHCPCAECQSAESHPKVDEDSKIEHVAAIGRYALKIQFSSGCSKGLYSFDYLAKLCEGL